MNQYTGDEKRTRQTNWQLLDWVAEVQQRGAGEMVHFRDAFIDANVDGALAESIFHKQIIQIGELKRYLRQHNIEIRE